MTRGRLDIVVKGYPRLSETFIAQELLGLERAGFTLRIWSLRHPTDNKRHALNDAIKAPVIYLPEYLKDEPRRVWRALRRARKLAGYRAALRALRTDLARDMTANRLRRWGQALVLAAELPDDGRLLHAHFIHTPGSVARYAALMRGLPLSFSAHARDIFTTPAHEHARKVADARFVAVCTDDGRNALARSVPAHAGRIHLIRHGLDFGRFPAFSDARPPRDGSDTQNPVRILSVGRAVEKKGFDDLLRALAMLDPALAWHFDHIGGGEGIASLEKLTHMLGLGSRVTFHGSRTGDEILAAMRKADIFALFARIAADGDRDGIPNVIVEAASQSLPVIATRVGGIPEIVRDNATGLLVDAGDVTGFAVSLAQLITDPPLRTRLGDAGRNTIARDFSFDAGLTRLIALLEGATAS